MSSTPKTKQPRCQYNTCKKKLCITDFPCKCEKRYCQFHRLPELHECIMIEKQRIQHQEYLKETLIDARFEKIEKF